MAEPLGCRQAPSTSSAPPAPAAVSSPTSPSSSVVVLVTSVRLGRRRFAMPSCRRSRHHRLLLGAAARCSQPLAVLFSMCRHRLVVEHRHPEPSSSRLRAVIVVDSLAVAPACLLCCALDGQPRFGPSACH
ncbi:hypothetical protein E2562_035610 [Oryza meyeriana var. granulata]|uniref:Uncharacterized protein n=1 Tax=Oryza meyeriana var. granulata TaxID=110450 RepID=A0A6G1ESU3_9ORYZ|nr:hypothetical protein E2562_035610 [Oryza meyeriana var. granulata]